MSRLKLLRSRLASLSRRRWLVRLLSGYSGLLVAIAWALIGAFILDWLLEMDRPYRIVSLAAIAATAVWAFIRYAKPALGQSESVIEMALFVEGQHKIDSDFVAALEFENPQAAAWGSGQLQGAVIDQVADETPSINVYQGLDYRAALRRLVVLASMVLAVAVAVGWFPGHASAFFNRLLLGSAHYPTRTMIQQVTINGVIIELIPGRQAVVRCPYGSPLEFVVRCSGESPEDLPDLGIAELWILDTEVRTELELLPKQSGGKTAGSIANASGRRFGDYTGRLPELINSVGFQLYIGDAWTDPAEVRIIPLPRVDVTLRVTPPAYAASGDASLASPGGALQVAVIEGSRVDVILESNKPLAYAVLTIKKEKFQLVRNQAAAEQGRETWSLVGDTPLARVVEPMYYRIQVQDLDDLKQEKEGYIHMRPDNPPKAYADVRTRHVLKTAVANIFYGASDDFGLAALHIHVRVLRNGRDESPTKQFPLPLSGRPRRVSSLLFRLTPDFIAALNQKRITSNLKREFAQRGVSLSSQAEIPFARSGGGRWTLADLSNNLQFEIRDEYPQLNVYRVYPLRLSEFDLQVGDQVRIELRAVDDRGDTPGKSASSESITLSVTDEAGFFASTTETDQRSAKQLDAIIRLGLGESP